MKPLILKKYTRQEYKNEKIIYLWQFSYTAACLQKKASSINSLTDYLNVLIDILRIEIKDFILFYII